MVLSSKEMNGIEKSGSAVDGYRPMKKKKKMIDYLGAAVPLGK